MPIVLTRGVDNWRSRASEAPNEQITLGVSTYHSGQRPVGARFRSLPRRGHVMTWLKMAVGLLLAASLIGVAAFHAYSERLAPRVQSHGTTYYNGESFAPPVVCKSEKEIIDAIHEVHAKYNYLSGPSLQAFERRALMLQGLPPLHVDELYVITEDDKLRDGETVLFIGLKADCVSIVFGFPARLYYRIVGRPRSS